MLRLANFEHRVSGARVVLSRLEECSIAFDFERETKEERDPPAPHVFTYNPPTVAHLRPHNAHPKLVRLRPAFAQRNTQIVDLAIAGEQMRTSALGLYALPESDGVAASADAFGELVSDGARRNRLRLAFPRALGMDKERDSVLPAADGSAAEVNTFADKCRY